MKFRLALLTLTALAAPLAAHAQPVDGLYIAGGVGFDYLNEVKGKSLTLPVAGTNGAASTTTQLSSGRFRSNGGFVGLASIGFGLGNGLRIEGEGNYRENHVKVTKSDGIGGGGQVQEYGAFLNAFYDIDVGSSFVMPYVGVGVGYIWNTLEDTRLYTNGTGAFTTSQAGLTFDNAAKGAVAGQGIIGVAFPITDAISLTTEARFMGQFTQQKFKGPTTLDGVRTGTSATVKLDNFTNESFLVGLRYAFNVPTPPPPAAPAPVAVPSPAPARTYLVFFDWDRSDLTARAKQIIGEAAANVAKVSVTRIEVNGYTDLSGTAAYNQKLSVRRADAVKAELIKDGVASGTIETHGYGESNPLVPTAKGVREPQNRRVEIILK